MIYYIINYYGTSDMVKSPSEYFDSDETQSPESFLHVKLSKNIYLIHSRVMLSELDLKWMYKLFSLYSKLNVFPGAFNFIVLGEGRGAIEYL